MEIKIHSFGTPESRDFRCILEGMYRRVGKVESVDFPCKETIRLVIAGEFDYLHEYGIHRMSRFSPRFNTQWQHKSFVMVEIDGKTRDELVCTYEFEPHKAKNLLNGRETSELFEVLGGKPLGLHPIYDMSNQAIKVPQYLVMA